MTLDPRATIAAEPMRPAQVAVVATCIALNALDGFDVLAISFAAPGIASEWGVDKAVLGIVLSMELIGMAAGSLLLGNLADRIGRRPTILACLCVMAAGMIAASRAGDVTSLSVIRLITGIGIGGMLSATSAMVAEFANDRRRGLATVLNIAGYSTGAILGGLVAAGLLANGGDWRAVFVFGGAMTLVALPLAFLLLPESIDFLLARRPANALAAVNRTLARLHHPPLAVLPAQETRPTPPSILALFSPRYRMPTVLLTVAYFAQITLFYYVQKWVPKIVVDLGFDAAQAARVLVAANVGNLLGALAIGLATQRLALRPLVGGAMVVGVGMIGVFGTGFADLAALSLSVGLAAFFINAGVVGLYPLLAHTYPASLRATGTGFVIGIGRGGSVVGPLLAGALFGGGAGLLAVSLVMGVGGIIAAIAVSMLRLEPSSHS